MGTAKSTKIRLGLWWSRDGRWLLWDGRWFLWDDRRFLYIPLDVTGEPCGAAPPRNALSRIFASLGNDGTKNFYLFLDNGVVPLKIDTGLLEREIASSLIGINLEEDRHRKE